ncbi:hypothetical protein AYO21_05631 [Fonsecaea monophora]|uniref:Uncharacterized protein n=1 Tax=Fonsecaea monophora TaxID=254056 RepID=A0A177F7I1_9EURO|nr:hypothetical protein AYO21_05631 [Fonsecaea monophora]OAG40153.1 hypothetical protein AYO21_05631 [Fonsecaea monophora]
MPITELIFPTYKLDAESLTALKTNESHIFSHLTNVNGLQAAFNGQILEHNGSPVDPKNVRTLLVLASFDAFYPKSEKFQAFINSVKPFVAAPAVPELYEQQERSIACTSTNVTQIFKSTTSDTIEKAWEQLKSSIRDQYSIADAPAFYHATGIKNDQGKFLGLIGWQNLQRDRHIRRSILCFPDSAGLTHENIQEYERVGKTSAVMARIHELSNEAGGEVENLVVQLGQI